MNNIINFPPSTTLNPQQALSLALDLANNDNLQDVLVVGYKGNGELLVLSSRMSRQGALWLAEQLRIHALKE